MPGLKQREKVSSGYVISSVAGSYMLVNQYECIKKRNTLFFIGYFSFLFMYLLHSSAIG
uniref:hypothetical protein n=1 Tax=Bacillus cytotoxicus TaxID=580165 RepID=UPI002040D948